MSWLFLPNLLASFTKTRRQMQMAFKCRICPMQSNKEKTADLVRAARLARGITQLELASLTRISLRTIQRIEKGEVISRSYTLKILAAELNVDLDFCRNIKDTGIEKTIRPNYVVKAICSAGLLIILLLLSAAFLSQTEKFPETSFETFLFWTLVSVVYTVSLIFIWSNRPGL